MKAIRLLIGAAAFLACTAQGDTIALWTFESPFAPATVVGSTVTGVQPNFGTGTASGVHSTSSTVYSFALGNGGGLSWMATRWDVGDYWEFHVSTLGFTGIQLSYAQKSDNGGPTNFTLGYSLDHTTFNPVGTNPYEVLTDSAGGSWGISGNSSTVRSFDLSAISSLANAQDVYFRLTSVTGTQITGHSRIDDFAVTGTLVPEPASLPIAAVVVFFLRRRLPRDRA